jgi:hypothetical protein
MTKKIKKVLPAAINVWPKLNEVDVYQPVDKKGRPSGAEKRRFITNLKFNDADHREVDAWLDEMMKKFDVEDGKKPWKKDKKTGELTLTVTSGEDYKPAAFDAMKNEIADKDLPKISGGTVTKNYVTVNPYTGFGGGINLYLNSYQILELVTNGGANPFEEEEGFTASKKNASASEDSSDADDEDEDDIPF